MTEKFRVGIITVAEVNAVDWVDATHIAEGAITYAIQQVDSGDDNFAQIRWRHYNGHDYEATIVTGPTELNVAGRVGQFKLEVCQPTPNEGE